MAECKEELKSLLMKVNEESEKAGLNPTFQKTGKNGNSDRFYFLGHPKSFHDCTHEIKRHFLIGRKAITNVDIRDILKSRDITLLIKV